MLEITVLHREAMSLADKADAARRQGDKERARDWLREAFKKERDAATQAGKSSSMEPTRSILLRSAASLALECGDMRDAEQIIATALAGDPPEWVADELRDLLEDVNMQRHHGLKGLTLDNREFQMSLEGPAIGHGMTTSKLFLQRVKSLQSLVIRTADRLWNQDFCEPAGKSKVELYISVPRAASFAVSFRVGGSQKWFDQPGMVSPQALVADMLDCMDLLDKKDFEQLKDRIKKPSYFRDFVGLAVKIAPDGKKVKSVGFVRSDGLAEKKVVMTTPGHEIKLRGVKIETEETADSVVYEGILLAADATGRDMGRIKIVASDGTHDVRVIKGEMNEMVKKYFAMKVHATCRAVDGTNELQNIEPIGENLS
ncbi:MAG TPA: hypothetical protein PL033_02935 [Candidatus Brocadiia bacterium]|nr:hypothetical protein [Candidatus Brocadiia bacterium]